MAVFPSGGAGRHRGLRCVGADGWRVGGASSAPAIPAGSIPSGPSRLALPAPAARYGRPGARHPMRGNGWWRSGRPTILFLIPGGWPSLLAPVFMYWILVHVTGIPPPRGADAALRAARA